MKETIVTLTSPKRAFYLQMLSEQQRWIQYCGGTITGYVTHYSEHSSNVIDERDRTVFPRSIDEIRAIYKADVAQLKCWKTKLKCKN